MTSNAEIALMILILLHKFILISSPFKLHLGLASPVIFHQAFRIFRDLCPSSHLKIF